jgi:hypothetical protein
VGGSAGSALNQVNLLRRTISVDRQLVEVGGSVHFGQPKTMAEIRVRHDARQAG